MFNLMEKTLFEKYYDEWGYIEPSGKKMLINTPHQVVAAQYLKKKSLPIPKTEEGTIVKYMLETGNIRFYVDMEDEGIEVALSIAAPVTSNQMKTIKTIVKGKGKYLIFDIFDEQGDSLYFGHGIDELISTLKGMNLFTKEVVIVESSIDFPREDLDKSIWDKDGDTYKVKTEVKGKVLDFIKQYSRMNLIDLAEEIHIVGSIASNQYDDDADIDVHIVPKSNKGWNEDNIKDLRKWFNKHRDEFDGYIENHPIEVYIQTNSLQDMMSVGNYDLVNDKWLTGPTIVDKNYDPYEDFSHIADDVKAIVKDADVLFGELKRDIIDFDVIKKAMERMSAEDKKKLLQKLELKLDEIESDIELLYKERKGFTDVRSSMDPKKALKDVEHMKQWQDDNATFKFINRYKYLKTIGDLNDLLKDDEVTSDEIDQIKSVMGMK